METIGILNLSGVGPVHLRRSTRAKRMSISMTASGEVHATLPLHGTVRQAKTFLCEKSDWITAHRQKACLLRLHHKKLAVSRKCMSWRQAEVFLRERIDRLAREYGFSFNRVSVRNQKTRWGSCSANNNISLNEKLTRLPDRLIDFVLLHELVHTRVKNHGRDFWMELGKYVDNVEALRKEFRQYRLDLL